MELDQQHMHQDDGDLREALDLQIQFASKDEILKTKAQFQLERMRNETALVDSLVYLAVTYPGSEDVS